jgi:hypothetical protein
MTKKPKKIKKKKITKRSRYYRWIESVGADVKIYPCQHERPDYKAVVALQEKTMEELKKRDKEVEELQVKLGECIERLILNNKDHEERIARYAKLYVGYKKKYQGLFTLRDAAINMGITEEQIEEEKEIAKDFEFKHKTKTLESGKTINQIILKKKHTKH